jgi:hypothetical protein
VPELRRPIEPFDPFPVIVVLSTGGDSVEHWLSAGQALQHVLLLATAHSLSATPMTQPLDYMLATDVWRLDDLHWYALTSMLKTPAAKHQAKIQTRYGLRTCFEARVHRDGKPDLVARFGGIPLVRDKGAVLIDRVPQPAPHPRKELIHRLLTRRCELCCDPGKVLVHQVRKLASLGEPGQSQPAGRRSWRPSDARPWWSAPPATTSSTPTLS